MSARVLLIEADDDDARLMTGMFGAAGYEVLRATEGRAGIELARQSQPALIMLAVELPGLSGYKACRDIKQDAQLQTIPLIITSSTATEDIFAQHATFKTRADEYLHKPLSQDVLLEAAGRFVPMDGSAGEDIDEEDDVLFLDDEAGDLDEHDDDGDDDVLFEAPDEAPTGSADGADDVVVVGDEMFADFGDDLVELAGDDGGLDLADVLDNIEVGSDILEVAEDLAPLEPLDEAGDDELEPLDDDAEMFDPADDDLDDAMAPLESPATHDDLDAVVEAPEAAPALDSTLEAELRTEIDTLTANNHALQAQIDELTERLNNAALNLKAEFDTMRAKLDGAREELQATRSAYFNFVSTLHTVLGEKAEELSVFGPFDAEE